MPAGVTWGQYLRFSAAAMLSMFVGSQVVHMHYKPLEDLDEYLNKELKHLPDKLQSEIKEELIQEGIMK